MLNSPRRRHLVILFYYAQKGRAQWLSVSCVCLDLLYPQGEKFVISSDVPVVSTNWQGNILNKLPAAGIDGMANDLESDMRDPFFHLIVLGFVLAKFHHNLIEKRLATPSKSSRQSVVLGLLSVKVFKLFNNIILGT